MATFKVRGPPWRSPAAPPTPLTARQSPYHSCDDCCCCCSAAQDYDGQRLSNGKPLNGCATCMFNTFSCGTMTCCPTSFNAKVVLYEDGAKAKFTDSRLCFVLRPSPIPCCMYCGFGPLAQTALFNKVSDTVYEGTGESMLGETGMCVACCHNKGDKMEIKDGGLVWTAGTNAVLYPPCLAGKESMRLHLVKGGAPTVAEMER
jgi:hypothetical protein